jgi:hypothetical protein
MTPGGEVDPEGIWCQYGIILIGHVPRFTREELLKYTSVVVPLFAEAYGLAHPRRDEMVTIAADALNIWRRQGDLTTRTGVQSVIEAFDAWRDRQ